MKKIFRFILLFIFFILLLLISLYAFGYGYLVKAVRTTYLTGHTTAFIDDYSYFKNRVIPNGDTIQEWPLHQEYNSIKATQSLDSLNHLLETAAFLVIKNDSLWFETYYQDYGKYSKTNSFSMAKSIVTAMMFKAIQEGYIENVDQPVSDFFPQFDPRLSVGDLSTMSSGLNWSENYFNPLGSTARAYFGKDLKEQMLELKVVEEPGEEFKYLSGNTQLLGMVIEKATGSSLNEYLSEKFWKPMGMNDEGLWQVDSDKNEMEKAFCCIASNARNFGKFGKLFKNYGEWNGNRILDSAYIAQASNPKFEDTQYYGYGFWLSDHLDKDIFYMRGVSGQYVIIIPEDDLVIVRLGKEVLGKHNNHFKDFYLYLDEVYKMLENAS